MATSDRAVTVYQELANWHDRRGQTQLRDRFLALAADTAHSAGQPEQAEELRRTLLRMNPNHLLRSSPSFRDALRSPDVQSYLADLRQSYPPEAAGQLLESLRGESGQNATASGPDTLKVYPLKDDRRAVEASRANRPRSDAPPEAIPVARVPVAQPVRTSPMPDVYSVLRQPRPLPPGRIQEESESGGRIGDWICLGLFLIVLAAGLAMAGYTFLRPFWAGRF